MNKEQSENQELGNGIPDGGNAAPSSMGVPPMGVHGQHAHVTENESKLLPQHSNSSALRSADPFFSGRKHFPELDGLRGTAIVLVLICHYSFWIAPPDWLVAILKLISFQGWIGVNLFFVLSGFLITGILLDSKGQQCYFRNFYFRRTLRIFPLYYGVLLSALAVLLAMRARLPNFYASDHHARALLAAMPWFFTYTTNIGEALLNLNASYFNHFWSLAVEEQFYLVWPMMVFALPARRLFTLCIGLAAAALACRIGMTLAGFSSGSIYLFTPCQLDPLAAGAAVAIILRDRELAEKIGRLMPWAAWILLVAVGAVLVGGPALGLLSEALPRQVIEYGNPARGLAVIVWPNVWELNFFDTLVALAFAFGLLQVISQPGGLLRRLLMWHPLRIAGTYSYGLYVYHYIVLALAEAAVYRLPWLGRLIGHSLAASLAFIVANAAVSFAIAFASYHLYEKHFLKLKKYFPERATAAVPPQ